MKISEIEEDFEAVTLEDIEDIKYYLSLSKYEESNHNIINMFIWIHWFPLFKVKTENYYLLLGIHEGTLFLYMPLCQEQYFDEAINHARSIFAHYQVDFTVSCFTENSAQRVIKAHPDLKVCPVYDSFDYIYETEKLVTLSGKKLQKKRNHRNAFYAEYQGRYSYESFNEKNIKECIEFLKNWKQEESEDEYFINEKIGVDYVLNNSDKLSLKGGCIRIDGEVKAFAIGSELSNTMCQMNVEKADSSIRGLYQAIMKEVIEHEFLNYQECNREDDLGRENIRQAKKAYVPSRMIKKYKLC